MIAGNAAQIKIFADILKSAAYFGKLLKGDVLRRFPLLPVARAVKVFAVFVQYRNVIARRFKGHTKHFFAVPVLEV